MHREPERRRNCWVSTVVDRPLIRKASGRDPQGVVRPTHAQRDARPRTWRTRKDPFEGVWSDVLLWLQQEPDATAKALLERLRPLYPGRFTDGQLRTLQRRVRQWRGVMAKELIYASADQPMPWDAATREIAPVGVDSRGSDFGNIPDEATRRQN